MNRQKPESNVKHVFARYSGQTGLITPARMVTNRFFDGVTSEGLVAWGIFIRWALRSIVLTLVSLRDLTDAASLLSYVKPVATGERCTCSSYHGHASEHDSRVAGAAVSG